MSTRMPPVPPENRTDKGPGGAPHTPGKDETKKQQTDSNQTGQEANTRINTTNQGYQQNR